MPHLTWALGVVSLLSVVLNVRGEDYGSCSVEGRQARARLLLPCDLVKNTFCDTSGDSYPWAKLRKYVFENQGLIKRMYGYDTHFGILKDELIALQNDGGHEYDPHEMYAQHNQHEDSALRYSVRSNTFSEGYPEDALNSETSQHFAGERRDYARSRSLNSNSRRSISSTEHGGGGPVRLQNKIRENDKNKENGFLVNSKQDQVTHNQDLDSDKKTVTAGSESTEEDITVTSSIVPDFNDEEIMEEVLTTKFPTGTEDYTDVSLEGHSVTDTTEQFSDGITETSEISSPVEETTFDINGLQNDEAEESVTTENTLNENLSEDKETRNEELSTAFSTIEKPKPMYSDYDVVDTNLQDHFGYEENESQGALFSESRISEGVHLNEESDHTGEPTEAHQESTENGAGFKFPDEVKYESPDQVNVTPGQPSKVQVGTKRRTNTRRPASGESRQPIRRRPTHSEPRPVYRPVQTNKNYISVSVNLPKKEVTEETTASEVYQSPSKPHRERVPIHSTNGVRYSTSTSTSHSHTRTEPNKNTNKQKPSPSGPVLWKRPEPPTEEFQSSTSLPPPPTPSTVPTPSSSFGYKKGVNACPVETDVVAPYWANNTRGEVLALLNLAPFEQYVHWEKCRFEYRQMYCRPGCRCEQQYRLHRMLAFDPTNDCRGIFSDWFRFPSGCVCKCYDIPDVDLTRLASSYSRQPKHAQPRTAKPLDAAPRSNNYAELNNDPEDKGDLTDVYFESPDDLLFIEEDEAQDRMDNFEEKDYENEDDYFSEPSVYAAQSEDQNGAASEVSKDYHEKDKLQDIQEPDTVPSKKTSVSNQSPQSVFRSVVQHSLPKLPDNQYGLPARVASHGYNLRFARPTRRGHYVAPRTYTHLNRYKYNPSPLFFARNKYYNAARKRYRNRVHWNPQAAFPRTLTNSRFNKYRSGRHITSSVGDDGTEEGLSKGSSNKVPSDSAKKSSVDQETPHYVFNLTSHLIRTQKLGEV